MSLQYKSHQLDGIDRLRQVKRGLLADEPGLGKTATSLKAVEGADATLIIAPALILNTDTWVDEIERWGHDPHKFWTAPYTMLNDRVPTFKMTEHNGKRVPLIVDGEKVRAGSKPVKRLRPDLKRRFDAVILDEAQYVKGRDTKWTWAVQQVARQADQVVAVTGTPIPNWAYETFTLLQILHPDEAGRGRRFGSFWRWAGEWFTISVNQFDDRAKDVGDLRHCYPECLNRQPNDPCEHYWRFINSNFGDQFIRHLRAECLDLPPLTRHERVYRMSQAQTRVYRELRKDFATTVSGQEVLSWSTGSRNVMLDKITTSPWLLTKEGPPRGGKLDLLREDLLARTGPTFVLAHYRDSVEACAQVATIAGLRAAFVHGGVTQAAAAKAVNQFKRGEIDVLVGSLETVSEGLTLTVADTAIFVESSYKPSRNEQATYRIHRIGQERPVTIIDYIAERTVDQRKRKLLALKTDRQMRMLTAAMFRDLL